MKARGRASGRSWLRLASSGSIVALALAGAASGGSAAAGDAGRPAGARVAPQPKCVRDPHGLATLYGALPPGRTASGMPSFVQITVASPAIDAYLGNLQTVLAGRRIVPSASDAANPDYMASFTASEETALRDLATASVAFVGPDGRFECSGFAPGTYVLVANRSSLGTSPLAPSLAGRVPFMTYLVGRAVVPTARRPVAIAVELRSIGRSSE